MEEGRNKRKRGPAKGPETVAYTLMLEEETAEWAKQQPGGLSEMVRRFLRQEMERRQRGAQETGQ